MDQKGFSPVLVIVGIMILLVLFGGFAYFTNISSHKSTIKLNSSPTPSSTTNLPSSSPSHQGISVLTSLATASASEKIPQNWKTYTNTAQGYQIAYPSDWINNGEQDKSFHISGTYEDIQALSTICFGHINYQAICELRISVFNVGWDKTKQYFDTIFESGTLQTINFNGVSGIKETGLENYANLGALVILLEKNNKEYLIQEFTDSEPQIDKHTLDQILASYKFLDQK